MSEVVLPEVNAGGQSANGARLNHASGRPVGVAWDGFHGSGVIGVLGLVGVLLGILHPALGGRVLGSHAGHPPFEAIAVKGTFTDIERAILPFLAHSRHEYAEGRVPLWNPYAGAGAPFLANEQSAVLHPFTLLTLLVPFPYGLLLLAALRLALAYTGMWLLARDLGFGATAAASTGVAFAMSGATVHWIGFPMGGVLAHLPLLVALGRRRGRGGAAWPLVLALVSTVLSGHFEYLPILWLAASIAGWVAGGTLRALARVVGPMAGASLLSAVMLLPCVEYLEQSLRFRDRRASHRIHMPLPLEVWPAVIDPAVRAPFKARPSTFASFYFGSAGLFLAACGAVDRRGLRWLLLGAFVVALLTQHPVSSLAWKMPPLAWMERDRCVFVLWWILSLLAGRGLGLVHQARAQRAGALAIVLSACLLLWGPGAPSLRRLGWLLGGVLLLLGVRAVRRLPRAGPITLGLVLLLERVFGVGSLNRFTQPDALFPTMPEVEKVRDLVGHERFIARGDFLPANIATVYGLRDARLYDAISVAEYDRLIAQGEWVRLAGDRYEIPSRASRLASARILALPAALPPLETGQRDCSREAPRISPGSSLTQPFAASRGSLSSIALHFRPGERPRAITVSIRTVGGCTLWTQRLRARWLPREGWKRVAVRDGLPLTGEERLQITVAVDLEESEGVVLSAGLESGACVALDGKPQPGRTLAYLVEYREPAGLVEIGRIGSHRILRDPAALPRARLSSRPTDASAARIEHESSSEIVVAVSARDADRLVLADVAYPGWEARLSGREVSIGRKGPFRAVDVPAGACVVTFRYRPASYRIGLFLSLMGLSLSLRWRDGPASEWVTHHGGRSRGR